MKNIRDKTILYAPLDWGFGHATRSVPIIRELLNNHNKVILGVTPLTLPLLEDEFPALKKVTIPAYDITYSSILPLWLKLAFDSIRISGIIRKEKKSLEILIRENSINMVISDSRFGFYSKKVRSVLISHQVFLKTPFLNWVLQAMNRKYLLKFDELWIPDFPNKAMSLSGSLSHGRQFHPLVRYVGPKSRLKPIPAKSREYHCLILISGPQPQCRIFQDLAAQITSNHPALKFAVVSNNKQVNTAHNIDYFHAPNAETLSRVICDSEVVICRSGYSTLMDLYVLGKQNVILVPTPGQTEQQYLASYWEKTFGFKSVKQSKLRSLLLQ